MADRRPGFFGRFVKWLVIPALLAAAGVFAIGPYLNRVEPGAIKEFTSRPQQTTVPQSDPADVSSDTSKFGEPTLQVTVSPAQGRMRRRGRTLAARPRHRHRHRRKAIPDTGADSGQGAPKGTTDTAPPTSPDDAAGV